MKKLIITISILILIALGFIAYKTDLFNMNNSKDVDTSAIIKDYLGRHIENADDAVMISKTIMNDLDITNAKVRVLAADIVDTQSFDISRMNNIHTLYLGSEYIPSTTTENIFSKLEGKKGDDLAKLYVKKMIKHHKMNIDLSKDFIKKIDAYREANSSSQGDLVISNSHPSIDESYDLAKSIMDRSQKEIVTLEELYK